MVTMLHLRRRSFPSKMRSDFTQQRGIHGGFLCGRLPHRTQQLRSVLRDEFDWEDIVLPPSNDTPQDEILLILNDPVVCYMAFLTSSVDLLYTSSNDVNRSPPGPL